MSTTTISRSTALTAGIALGFVLILGLSAIASSQEDIALYPEKPTPEQAEAISGGVSIAEYDRAFSALVQCADESGVEIAPESGDRTADPQFDPVRGEYRYIVILGSSEDESDRKIELFDACYGEHLFHVDRAVARQRAVSAAEQPIIRAKTAACLEERGHVLEPGDLLDQVSNMLDLEECRAEAEYDAIGDRYFAPPSE